MRKIGDGALKPAVYRIIRCFIDAEGVTLNRSANSKVRQATILVHIAIGIIAARGSRPQREAGGGAFASLFDDRQILGG